MRMRITTHVVAQCELRNPIHRPGFAEFRIAAPQIKCSKGYRTKTIYIFATYIVAIQLRGYHQTICESIYSTLYQNDLHIWLPLTQIMDACSGPSLCGPSISI